MAATSDWEIASEARDMDGRGVSALESELGLIFMVFELRSVVEVDDGVMIVVALDVLKPWCGGK